jgi:hypothetical protein
LDDTNHNLTITKLDTNGTSIAGFLVDDASTATRHIATIVDYHMSLNQSFGNPININASNTIIVGFDFWILNAVVTNTTSSPINVTLKNWVNAVILGPFPVPANDFRAIPCPLFFGGGMQALASATGCFITIGGQ